MHAIQRTMEYIDDLQSVHIMTAEQACLNGLRWTEAFALESGINGRFNHSLGPAARLSTVVRKLAPPFGGYGFDSRRRHHIYHLSVFMKRHHNTGWSTPAF